MHISIIGAGQIGRLVGFNLLTDSALFKTSGRTLNKLTFVDRKEMEFEGHRRDLLDAAHMNGMDDIIIDYAHTDDMAAVKGSDAIVVTASVPLTKEMKREDLLKQNRGIAENIGKSIHEYAPHAFTVVVSNPMDIMVALIQHYAKCPKGMICGSGPYLDTVRAWRILPEYLGGDVEKAKKAYVLGQHGANMIPFMDKLGVKDYDKARQEIVDEAYTIAQFNAYSSYAPAMNITKLLRCFITDKAEVLPVCSFYEKAYLGVLGKVSGKGVTDIHFPEMSEREHEENQKCIDGLAKVVAETIAQG